ncbi:translation termination inhibitor protein Itt1p [[Candida] anglica]|uniref:RBR-type E3 ubiquitin transferase n=1 Tax=[Candida] anglica TaxID=148631 RepID=A0ABP0EEV3_9ASCO
MSGTNTVGANDGLPHGLFSQQNFLEADFSENVRLQELQSLVAIFPDTNIEGYSGSLDIPITLDSGVKVIGPNGDQGEEHKILKHLPPIIFSFSLPEGYPFNLPPTFKVVSNVISTTVIDDLNKELKSIWETYHDQVLFSMIDLIQQKVVQVEGSEFIHSPIDCSKDSSKYKYLQEFDIKALEEEFNKKSFTCQICQDDFKGINCTQFASTCNHVFCNNCLYDYFTSLIISGEISKVHCPDFECTKEFLKIREKYLNWDDIDLQKFNFDEFKSNLMRPPISLELLKRIIGQNHVTTEEAAGQLVQRYKDLFIKQQYDLIGKVFPTRLVSCPRTGCSERIFRNNLNDSLVICRKCNYAFCNSCRKSWHGTLNECERNSYSQIPTETLELWLQSDKDSLDRKILGYKYGRPHITKLANDYLSDKLFNEMIQDESQGFKKCPTCHTIIQKLDGCNKMVCSTCQSFFCNICGIYLEKNDPYEHFRELGSSCYGKLFEGMPGLQDQE